MKSIHSQFSPARYGFLFVNSFDLLPRSLPSLGKINLNALTTIGLCGGMCFAALDYFFAGNPIPRQYDTAEIPAELLNYLRKRQAQSVNLRVLWKLFRWVVLSDRQVAALTLNRELPALISQLEGGTPAVLLLVGTHGLQNLTLNHQAIATGYTQDPASGEVTIALYDPNHPGMEPTLSLRPNQLLSGVRMQQTTGEIRRGFFVQKYQTKAPPVVN